MTEINDAIRWWEQELTGDKRTELLKGKTWSGPIEERHTRLIRLYREAHKGLRLENGNYICRRCNEEVQWEDLMLVGCQKCGGDNGSSSYGALEAKFSRGMRRLNGTIYR